MATSSSAGPAASGAPVDRRISVVIRFRPHGNRTDLPITWRLSNNQTVTDHWAASSSSAPLPATSQSWTFDRVYGPEASTADLFQDSVKDIVHASLEGINGTIFAYGQTASGKTFTMHGDQKEHGVIPYTIHEMFKVMDSRQRDHEYLMSVSYLEIYNENLMDLLGPSSGGQQVRLYDRPDGSLDIRGLSETRINNEPKEIFDCLVGVMLLCRTTWRYMRL